MIAASDGSDRSDGAASSFSYEDFFSILHYYGHMSKAEILGSSRKYLNAIYQNYVKRACENLGVSADGDNESKTKLSDSDYPSKFVSFSQAEREKYIKESGESDKDFLEKFSSIKRLNEKKR